MREALLGVAVGKKGIGKTYTTLQIINQYIKGGLNIKPRRALILDVNDEFESVRAIRLDDVKLFSYHPKIECRRIRPYNEDGSKMTLNEVADALDIDFLQFDDLEVDHLEEDESQFSTGLEIDFLEQNFLADILKQINKELAKAMRSEFDKRKTTGDITLGKDPETGVIILDEDPQWVWIREDASGSYIELRLDKEYGYVLNIVQGEFEQYDFELGGVDNAITIEQVN